MIGVLMRKQREILGVFEYAEKESRVEKEIRMLHGHAGLRLVLTWTIARHGALQWKNESGPCYI